MRLGRRRCVWRAAFVSLVLAMGLWVPARANVVTYPAPDGAPQAADFQVSVDGQAQFVYNSEIAAFATFSFTGQVHVAVTPQKVFTHVDIRPKNRGVTFAVKNQTIHFDLDEPCQLSIELDGDIERPLFLFANPPEKKVPKPGVKRVHYFGPGRIHEAGEIVLKSDETLYIAGGAIVRGRVRADGAKNVSVRGRGILDGTHRDYKTQMVKFSECTGVNLDGIVILNSYGWTVVPVKSDNVKISNVKIVGWRDNDDGVDIVGCRNLAIVNSFLRTKDDCIAIKASPGYFKGGESGLRNVQNVAVVNSVLWNAEWGNAMEIGFELQTASISGIIFKDCDIIHVERGGTFTIHNGDWATVENIRFEDIRVEDSREKLIEFRIGLSIYSGDCPREYHRQNPDRKRSPLGQWMPVVDDELSTYAAKRGRIRNIHFKNIEVTGEKPPTSFLIGYDDGEHSVQNVTLEDLRINGVHVSSADKGNMTIERTKNVLFK
jgi:Glycosyl hydrolases family 28